jgi:hypothetical protein
MKAVGSVRREAFEGVQEQQGARGGTRDDDETLIGSGLYGSTPHREPQRHFLADAARQTQGHLEAPFGPLRTLEHDQLADGDALWCPGCWRYSVARLATAREY